MKRIKIKSWLVFLILGLSLLIFLNNALAYPVDAGYDYWRRALYTKIISQEFRLPSYEETSEAYDAPLFYFVSGLTTRVIKAISQINFHESLGLFRFISAILAVVSFWLWTKMFSLLNPKNRYGPMLFLFVLASMPVFYKVGAMYLSEMLILFLTTITFYFFITSWLKSPGLKNTLGLAGLISMGLLTRISFLAVLVAILIGIIIWYWGKKKITLALKPIVTIILIASLTSGWFYFSRYRGNWFNIGYDKNTFTKDERRGLDFYFHLPIKVMLTYPFRPVLSEPSYLWPIYYADFWGDYWNYFPQRRFGEAEFNLARANRQIFSPARKKYLAWQSRVNLVPTLLMVGAFLSLLISRVCLILKRKVSLKIMTEFVFLMPVLFTWISMLILATKYPGQGDVIKASYTAFIAPVYAYSTVFGLFLLKKIKIVFRLLIIILIFSSVNNFIFSWF
ncbi:ArnT family glycosyltransferase [Patescibacteria group bacterium]